MKIYVYSFPDGKHYVGQTKYDSAKRAGPNGINYKTNPELFAAFEQYGYDNVQRFEYEVNSFEELDLLEKFLIAAFQPEYNRNKGGSHGYKPINVAATEIKKMKESLPQVLDTLKDKEISSPYIDSGATGVTKATHLYQLAYNRTLDTLISKAAEHPEWVIDKLYSSAELRATLSYNTFAAATDSLKGLIIKESYGKYKLQFLKLLSKTPQEQRNIILARISSLDVLIRKFGDAPLNEEDIYSRKNLILYCNDVNLASGVKYGFITRTSYGFYQLPFLKLIRKER